MKRLRRMRTVSLSFALDTTSQCMPGDYEPKSVLTLWQNVFRNLLLYTTFTLPSRNRALNNIQVVDFDVIETCSFIVSPKVSFSMLNGAK